MSQPHLTAQDLYAPIPSITAYITLLNRLVWGEASHDRLLVLHIAARGGKPYRVAYNVAFHMNYAAEQFVRTGDWSYMTPPFYSDGWGDYDPISYTDGVKQRILSTNTPQSL